jgi:hypothetical protein
LRVSDVYNDVHCEEIGIAMIRKQLYLERRQQHKLRRIAARLRCTEAEVMRKAIERLPEPEESLDDLVAARLAAAGILAPPPDVDDIASEAEAELLEQEVDRWDKRHGPTRLGEAVLQERRARRVLSRHSSAQHRVKRLYTR